MQTEKTIAQLIFNPETMGGVLIRLYVAASILGALSVISLIFGGIR